MGLLGPPARTSSGYRNYDDESATRLLFVSRAGRMGFSCDQISEVLPVWDGTNCSAAYSRVMGLLAKKQAEIAGRIADLEEFSHRLDDVRAMLAAAKPPPACRTDLSCCVPEGVPGGVPTFVPVELLTPRRVTDSLTLGSA